ncbi:class I SAM-dependent methyltransferase [Streptomyces nigrescens]
MAEEYATRLHNELAEKPLDRALLACLLEQTEPGAAIADLGCGPGHVAAWLAEKGARTVGIDLSAGMIEAGRRRFAQVEFREGDLLELPAKDAFVAPVESAAAGAPGRLRCATVRCRRRAGSAPDTARAGPPCDERRWTGPPLVGG